MGNINKKKMTIAAKEARKRHFVQSGAIVCLIIILLLISCVSYIL